MNVNTNSFEQNLHTVLHTLFWYGFVLLLGKAWFIATVTKEIKGKIEIKLNLIQSQDKWSSLFLLINTMLWPSFDVGFVIVAGSAYIHC